MICVCVGVGGDVTPEEIRSDDVMPEEVRSDDVAGVAYLLGGVMPDDLSEEESWEIGGGFLFGESLEEEERDEEDVERIEEVDSAEGGGED